MEISTTIRFAVESDFSIIRTLDPHSKYIDPEKIKNKISQKEIILAQVDGHTVGLIKFSYLWATRPFLDLIFVMPEMRNKGISKQLLAFWENYLRNERYCYAFSSAEKTDDFAQSWHHNNNFVECGEVTNLNLPHDSMAEVFFYKRIATEDTNTDKLREYQ